MSTLTITRVVSPVTVTRVSDGTVVSRTVQDVAVSRQVTGLQGPPGPVGETGPSGAAAASYRHIQSGVSASWVIVHNLGAYPNVTVVDSGGTVVEGDIAYDSDSQVTLTFSSAFSGTAYLS